MIDCHQLVQTHPPMVVPLPDNSHFSKRYSFFNTFVLLLCKFYAKTGDLAQRPGLGFGIEHTMKQFGFNIAENVIKI